MNISKKKLATLLLAFIMVIAAAFTLTACDRESGGGGGGGGGNGSGGGGNGGGDNTGGGGGDNTTVSESYDYTLLPENVKITYDASNTSLGFTVTDAYIFIKIGNDFYSEELVSKTITDDVYYLKHSGGSWTEYYKKGAAGWAPAEKTYNAAEVKKRLFKNAYLGGLVDDTINDHDVIKSAGDTIEGLETEKYTKTIASISSTWTFWHSPVYKLNIKYTYVKTSSPAMSAEIIVTAWDTSVASFAGAGVTGLPA